MTVALQDSPTATTSPTVRMPTRKDEHWRFTNLRGLDMDAVETESTADISMSVPVLPDGAFCAPLSELDPDQRALVEPHLGSLVGEPAGVDDYFVGLMPEGLDPVVVYVARNVQVNDPIEFGIEHQRSGATSAWRLLVILEEGAQANVVEGFHSAPGADEGFSNAVVELVVGRNARLGYLTTQQYARGVWHFATHRAALMRDATVDWTVLGTGGRGGKSRMEVFMREPGSNANLTGAYFVDGRQAIDYDTLQVHEAPNATSDLSFKGVLAGKGRGVWRGMIVVDKGAQGTDSYQDNRNLMLSNSAHADSIPGLQIEANEVRCTHGSTIGKIDPEQLFYLKARGLSEAEATRMLVQAFLVPVLDRIADEAARESVQQGIMERLDQALAQRATA